MKTQRRLSASEVIDAICRRELGLPLTKCNTGSVDAETAVAALATLLKTIGETPVGAIEWIGEIEEREADDVIARMGVTGSFDPVRFLPASSQGAVRTTIRVAMDEYRLMPTAPYRLRDLPDRLQGNALGLAALALHALRP